MNPWRLHLWPPTANRGESAARTISMLIVFGQPLAMWALIRFVVFPARPTTPFGPAGPSPLPLAWTLLIASLVLSLLAFAVWSVLWTRAKREVQRLHFRLCPNCRYDLSACQPDGLCPECGRAYTDADLRRIWRAAYRL